MKKFDLVHHKDEWLLRTEGSNRALLRADTKSDAIDQMRNYMAKHPGSVNIHKMDGKFQEERTYPRSADPRKSKG